MGEKLEITIHADDKASGPIKQVSGELKNLGSSNVQGGLKGSSSALAAFGTVAKGIIAGGALATIAMQAKEAMDATMKWGASIDQLGDMFGMSGETASTWSVAMQHVGVGVEEGSAQLNYFTRMLKETDKALKDGEGKTTPFGESLARLGVSAQDSGGKLKSFEAIMPEIMDAFKELPAGVEATAIAMDLFGARGGSKFLDLLRQGSGALDEASEKARQFGLSMDTATSDKIELFDRKLNDVGMLFEGLKTSVGIGLIEPLTGALDLMDQLALGLGGMTAQPYELKFTVTGLESIGVMPMSTSPGASTVGPLTFDMTKTLDQNRETWGLPVTAQETPWGDPNARWFGMEAGLKSQAKYEDDVRRMRAVIQGISGSSAASASTFGSSYGGASSFGATSAAASMGFNDYLAATFPDIGAAQGWMGAFSSQHGGRAATQVDLRDKMAGDAFMQKYGRAATQGEWEQRYYTGSFAGMEGEEAGLDKIFGPNGTMISKMDEQRKQDKESFDKLLAAFEAASKPTYSVQIVGRRITD